MTRMQNGELEIQCISKNIYRKNHMSRKIRWESYHVEDTLDDFITNDSFADEVDDEFSDMGVAQYDKPPQLFNTPFGWVNLDQSLNPFTEHKLWKMYTNFNIGIRFENTVTQIEGVEVFTVITRYLCIIGVGKLFDSPTVRYNIETALDIDRGCDEIEQLQNRLSEYAYWGIIQLPNGSFDHFVTDDKDDFEQNMFTYEEASNLSGGQCYSSERNNG